MSKLDLFTKLANPEQLIADLLDETNDLGHASTLKTAKKADLDKTLDLPVPGAKATFAGQLEVALLNDEKDGDQDPAGVFGAKRKPLPELPWLAPGAGQVWLRYAAELRAGLSGEAAADPLSASLQLETDATLAAYRVHTPDELLVPALRSDLGDFRTLLSLEHLQAAAVGEVHSLILGADLKFSLQVAFAEVLPAAVRELKVRLADASDLVLNCSASAKVSANFGIAGDYALHIGKPGPERHVVSLRRASTRTLGARLDIGAEIKVEIPPLKSVPALDGLHLDLISRLTGGVTEDDLKKLEAYAAEPIAQLPADLREHAKTAAASLAKRLGKAVNTRVDDLLKDYATLLAHIETAFQTGFKTSLRLGLGLAWSRVEKNEILAQATLTPEELRRIHPDLLRLQADSLRAIIAAGGERESHFLSTRSLVINTSLTFGLVLPGFALKTDASRERAFTWEEDIEKRLRPAYAEKITRADTRRAETHRCHVAFSAHRDIFEHLGQIELNEFLHTLTLRLDYDDRHVSAADVRQYVDTAALWSGSGETPAELQARIDTILDWHEADPSRLRLRCELVARPAALAALWRSQPDEDLIAECLAAAMGPGERHPVLFDIATRTSRFSPIWLHALRYPNAADQQQFAAEVTRFAADHLKPIDPALAKDQRQPRWTTHDPKRGGGATKRNMRELTPHSAGSVAYALPSWRKSIRALGALGHHLVTGRSQDWERELPNAADRLVPLRADPIYLRFYGRLLQRLAARAGIRPGADFAVSLVAQNGDGAEAEFLALG